ncbi:MAG: hypothetical protein CMI90_02690 [Pelagibacteraceae bacterium]|nr:hypothetical protein [Pelagibacteraceae bacterium]
MNPEALKFIKNEDLITSTEKLNSLRSYLEGLDREQIVHIIKLSIYFIEKNKDQFEEDINETFLNEINKIPLTNDLNNNLFFKYRKNKIDISSIAIILDNKLITFTNSIFLNFKLRNPMILIPYSEDQELILKYFIESLNETKTETNFLKLLLRET